MGLAVSAAALSPATAFVAPAEPSPALRRAQVGA
eukprot:CAMPEP_0181456914 /NCGR_PEP_ID=MMETSP1110-20121109/31519_1 /TAXON_ID=174948 /ORGANISM="Symbiodinium sp., Strain CCMP421" /LENGTH=33 /DNA_ID= /DNA_START= /DNA_END= /DNA_ORIENTATION=